MNKDLAIKETIQINAPINEVWDALINPEKIKQYFFGTNALSDWKEGSSIAFRGEWQGKPYEDKGIITKLSSEKVFEYSYWSPHMGTEDKSENYSEISFKLSPTETGTTLEFEQKGFGNEKSMNDSAGNWEQVFEDLKRMLEQ